MKTPVKPRHVLPALLTALAVGLILMGGCSSTPPAVDRAVVDSCFDRGIAAMVEFRRESILAGQQQRRPNYSAHIQELAEAVKQMEGQFQKAYSRRGETLCDELRNALAAERMISTAEQSGDGAAEEAGWRLLDDTAARLHELVSTPQR